MYTSKLKRLYTAFLHSIELSGYGMVKNLGKYPLPEEQNKYATKIVNAYIDYDLDGWPRNSS